MKYILLLLIALFSVQSYAVDNGDWWLQRQIQIGDGKNAYGKNVYGKAARSVMESVPIKDSTREEVRQLIKRSIAVDKPTPAKVGTPMLKRLYSPQAIVGTAVVAGLLGAIGWVMEDGTYIKKETIHPDDDPNTEYYWPSYDKKFMDPMSAFNYWKSKETSRLEIKPTSFYYNNNGNTAEIDYTYYSYPKTNESKLQNAKYSVNKLKNPNYDPNKKPKEIKHPLTAPILGAIMLGAGYSDPAGDTSAEDKVNTGDYTGVKEIYEHDSSGVGNERADDMDEKLKNAKPTDDGNSSYIGDPKYDSKPLTDNRDDSADRGWDEKGDEATGGTEQEKDPETGEATGNQSITIQFPLFCSWASSMCKWYDDWQASDKVHQKFEEDVKNHQSDEKSFWQKIEDWFDWTKEEPEPQQPETPQVDDQGIFSRTFDTAFSLSSQCPPDIPINFESTYISGNFTFSMNWLCIIFSFMAYPLVFLSHCVGIWILYEAVIQKEIKW